MCSFRERRPGSRKGILEQYLAGDSLPNLQTLGKIAQASGVSIGWLIGEEQVPDDLEYKKKEIANESLRELIEWIGEQDDGINYWEVLKAKLAMENPQFLNWLEEEETTIATFLKTVLFLLHMAFT